MKLYKIVFIAFSLIISVSSKSQIPNSSFENWTQVNGVLEPDGWITNNSPGAIAIQRDTNSLLGDFSISIGNNAASLEPEGGIASTYIINPNGAYDTLYIPLNVTTQLSSNHWVQVQIKSYGYFPQDQINIWFTDSITSGYMIWEIPLNLTQVPDSLSLLISVDCSCQTPIRKVLFDGISFSPPLSNFEYETVQIANIYPLPVEEVLNIQVPLKGKDITLKIYTMAGKEVFSSQYLEEQINVSFLTHGEYLLLIETSNSVYRRKFLKQ